MSVFTKGKKGEVWTLKLTTAEEILGRVTKVTGTEVEIEGPATLVLTQKQTVALTPYTVSTDPKAVYSFFVENVVTSAPARKDFADSHAQQLTGLVPNSDGLVLNSKGE